MEDPNTAVAPDFVTQEFQEEQQPFLNIGFTEQQAATALQLVWQQNNKRAKANWARRQQEQTLAAEEAHLRDEALQQEHEEEEAQILHKEHKKNKAKFTPIPDIEAPSEPIIMPSQAALHRLQQHKFCELWYFTNDSLCKASTTHLHTLDDETLSLLPSADSLTTLIPSVSA
ncbi:hypothetical protein ID866_12170 [Astraeus odoratus]|nr:hypothetical protein ID866_12170 [Astraeus odoratus]